MAVTQAMLDDPRWSPIKCAKCSIHLYKIINVIVQEKGASYFKCNCKGTWIFTKIDGKTDFRFDEDMENEY